MDLGMSVFPSATKWSCEMNDVGMVLQLVVRCNFNKWYHQCLQKLRPTGWPKSPVTHRPPDRVTYQWIGRAVGFDPFGPKAPAAAEFKERPQYREAIW